MRPRQMQCQTILHLRLPHPEARHSLSAAQEKVRCSLRIQKRRSSAVPLCRLRTWQARSQQQNIQLLLLLQSRPQLCKSVQQSVREVYGDDLHVFDRPIEYTIRIAECPMTGMSILDYEPGNPAAESYRNLASEVLRLG